jgi:hypothetical protein
VRHTSLDLNLKMKNPGETARAIISLYSFILPCMSRGQSCETGL